MSGRRRKRFKIHSFILTCLANAFRMNRVSYASFSSTHDGGLQLPTGSEPSSLHLAATGAAAEARCCGRVSRAGIPSPLVRFLHFARVRCWISACLRPPGERRACHWQRERKWPGLPRPSLCHDHPISLCPFLKAFCWWVNFWEKRVYPDTLSCARSDGTELMRLVHPPHCSSAERFPALF